MDFTITNAKDATACVTLDGQMTMSHSFGEGFNPEHIKPIESLLYNPLALQVMAMMANHLTPELRYAHLHTDTIEVGPTGYSGFNVIYADGGETRRNTLYRVRLLRHSASRAIVCFEQSIRFQGKKAFELNAENMPAIEAELQATVTHTAA